MIIKEIINELEAFARLSLQESWDNCGVQVGDVALPLKGVVLCVDITEETVEKAIKNGFNLIISHHPLIFSGLKSITGKNSTERIVTTAIKNDLVIYSAHTNFDKAWGGVSFALAEKIGLKNVQVFVKDAENLKKLVVYAPKDSLEKIENAAFEAGAGRAGNYENCSFSSTGFGTFKACEGANPYVGEIGKLHRENEVKFETIVTADKLYSVLEAVKKVHPYEEVGYDVFDMDVTRKDIGLGVIGEIELQDFESFSGHIKEILGIPVLRHSKKINKLISKVALCGGSGASFIKNAINCNADIYLSGDFKYHDFQVQNDKIMIMDIGHFESEKFIIGIFYDIVTKKISNFADHILIDCENSVNYI